jgi:hypothetical protein
MTARASPPVQPDTGDWLEADSGTGEDCLLNVWAPEQPAAKALPVAVYVDGGAFEYGTAPALALRGKPSSVDGHPPGLGASHGTTPVITRDETKASLGPRVGRASLSPEAGRRSGQASTGPRRGGGAAFPRSHSARCERRVQVRGAPARDDEQSRGQPVLDQPRA